MIKTDESRSEIISEGYQENQTGCWTGDNGRFPLRDMIAGNQTEGPVSYRDEALLQTALLFLK